MHMLPMAFYMRHKMDERASAETRIPPEAAAAAAPVSRKKSSERRAAALRRLRGRRLRNLISIWPFLG